MTDFNQSLMIVVGGLILAQVLYGLYKIIMHPWK